jgi:hypothetical protein
MPEPIPDDLDVSTSREQPGGVGVAKIMDSDGEADARGRHSRAPDIVTEPLGRDVTFRVDPSFHAGHVLSAGSTVGTIGRHGLTTVIAPAFAGGVGRQRAVRVGAALGVRLGQPESTFFGVARRVGGRLRAAPVEEVLGKLEDQVFGAQPCPRDVVGQLRQHLRAYPKLPPVVVLGVVLHQKPSAMRVELGVEHNHSPGHDEHSRPGVEILGPQFGQLARAQSGLDVGFHHESHQVVIQRVVDGIELLGGDDLTHLARHRWVRTPLPGWSRMTRSLSAVVKTASRITLH